MDSVCGGSSAIDAAADTVVAIETDVMTGPPRTATLTCLKSRFGRPKDCLYVMQQSEIRLGDEMVRVVRSVAPSTGPTPDQAPYMTLKDRVLVRLRSVGSPVRQEFLVKDLRVRKQGVSDALRALESEGKVESNGEGKGATWQPV